MDITGDTMDLTGGERSYEDPGSRFFREEEAAMPTTHERTYDPSKVRNSLTRDTGNERTRLANLAGGIARPATVMGTEQRHRRERGQAEKEKSERRHRSKR